LTSNFSRASLRRATNEGIRLRRLASDKPHTLSNLYNQRPRWLADAHEALDRAVASAYGWPEDIAIDDALQRLLALNLERAAAQRKTDDESEVS